MTNDTPPNKGIGLLAILLGATALGCALYAVVETLPNFEYIHSVINDPMQRGTKFDVPLRESYLGTLTALFYASIGIGALALLTGLLSALKSGFKPAFLGAALGLAAAIWAPIWYLSLPDINATDTSTAASQSDYIESQERALTLMREHEGDCDAQADALDTLAREVGSANRAFVQSVTAMDPETQAETKRELRSTLQPVFRESDRLLRTCEAHQKLLSAYLAIVATP